MPVAASAPTAQEGTQDRPLSLSFGFKAPLVTRVHSEPAHVTPVPLHPPIFSVSWGFHRDEYGIRNEAL